MELQASVLERAETDIRDVLLKAARVADRLDELLNEQNQKRVMALVDSIEQHLRALRSARARLGAQCESAAGLAAKATRTVEKAQGAVDNVAKLAGDADRKLVVLDTVGGGGQAGRASGGRLAQRHPAARECAGRPSVHRRPPAQANAAPGQRAAAGA